jgi:polyhydroxybutyrate depolymerase
VLIQPSTTLLAFLLSILTIVCVPGWAQQMDHSVKVDGVARTYELHIPDSLPKPAPLVIVFHGGGGKASGIRRTSGMDKIADEYGFVAAYPQGIGLVWNDGGSDLTNNKFPRDDVAFTRALIKDIAKLVPIDEKQVFACGLSNGGCMSARLALEAPDIISAVAMVGSGLYEKQKQEHPNPHPFPVLFIEGTADPCYVYKGGQSIGPKFGKMFRSTEHGIILSCDDAISFWCIVNKCDNSPEISKIPHVTNDETSTTYKLWKGANGNDVAAYVILAGGHCWPGGVQYFPVSVIGKTTYDFSASEAIWQFFSKHSH